MSTTADQVRAMPRARVITVSTRAAAGAYSDTSGPLAVAALTAMGFSVDPVVVVADGLPVEQALRDAVADGVDAILTAGGTGLSPNDQTPQITSRLIDFAVPGIADLIRARAWDRIPTAALSRGVAGVAGTSLIVNLPGSESGVRDGMAVLRELLPHAVDQLNGGDHLRGATTPGAVVRATVTQELISVAEHESLVAGPDCGAVVSFAGVVRNHDHGRGVRELEYVGHPSADGMIGEVARNAATRMGVSAIAVTHRLGPIAIGETALACSVSAAHRQAAFDTCEWLVTEVKRRLPVWKRQEFADGSHEWVNCP